MLIFCAFIVFPRQTASGENRIYYHDHNQGEESSLCCLNSLLIIVVEHLLSLIVLFFSTGSIALQKKIMSLLRKIEHYVPGVESVSLFTYCIQYVCIELLCAQ